MEEERVNHKQANKEDAAMNVDEIKTWAAETRLIDEKGLRGSKHQKQIIKIQAIIRRLANEPGLGGMPNLLNMKFIECRGDTRFVAHCRYIQNRVKWIVKIVLFNEGTKE